MEGGKMVNDTVLHPPETIAETGLPRYLLEGLALKMVYLEGELSLIDLSERMRLSFPVVDKLFRHLRSEQLCEVTRMDGPVHRFTTTSLGKTRALEFLSQSQYSGPAPVSLKEYVTRVQAQTVREVEISAEDLEKAFERLVLSSDTLNQLGTAVVSGRSIFLYGPSGTGKTAIAETLPDIYRDAVWIPYAVEVEGQIITVYDAALHERVAEDEPADVDVSLDVADDIAYQEERDQRWVLCKRPRVVVGGELTIEMLELQSGDHAAAHYAAPAQMKANNGVLIIDDFGRQRVRPEELLNRWIIPLDRRIDFLSLPGGMKFQIPFDLFVVFATNLDPNSLADAAFLRRIQTKIKVDYVTRPQFHEIFQRVCDESDLEYDAQVVEDLMDDLDRMNEPLRPCYPRDIIQHVQWAARYQSVPPQLNRDTVATACRNYLISSAA
jgi:predicted ATPase with chaperone activity